MIILLLLVVSFVGFLLLIENSRRLSSAQFVGEMGVVASVLLLIIALSTLPLNRMEVESTIQEVTPYNKPWTERETTAMTC